MVVADRAGGIQRLVDVSRLDDLLALLRAIGPYASEAISLQLDADLQGIRLGRTHALPDCLDLIHDIPIMPMPPPRPAPPLGKLMPPPPGNGKPKPPPSL